MLRRSRTRPVLAFRPVTCDRHCVGPQQISLAPRSLLLAGIANFSSRTVNDAASVPFSDNESLRGSKTSRANPRISRRCALRFRVLRAEEQRPSREGKRKQRTRLDSSQIRGEFRDIKRCYSAEPSSCNAFRRGDVILPSARFSQHVSSTREISLLPRHNATFYALGNAI